MPTHRAATASLFVAFLILSAAPPTASPQAARRPATPAHAAPAQAPPAPAAPADPSPNLAGIAHIALRVSDLNASVTFYQRLGFVRAFALSRDGKVYEAFIKLNDRQFLELYPATPQSPQTGFLHLCFVGANLQWVHAFYVAQGLTPTAVRTAGAGNLLFTMAGPPTPTGPQNLEYTQYMPGSLHSKDFGQHLGPDRIATKLIAVTIAADDPTTASAFYTRIGFIPEAAGSNAARVFQIPGAPDASIEIVSADSLGFQARFTLQLAPGMGATALRARGISFLTIGRTLILHDPDGNEVDFASY
jgi:catechol 2,3-dioxygenase-like lactoylglutathione lyase family enzyme